MVEIPHLVVPLNLSQVRRMVVLEMRPFNLLMVNPEKVGRPNNITNSGSKRQEGGSGNTLRNGHEGWSGEELKGAVEDGDGGSPCTPYEGRASRRTASRRCGWQNGAPVPSRPPLALYRSSTVQLRFASALTTSAGEDPFA